MKIENLKSWLLASGSLLLVLIIDMFTPLGVAVGVLYVAAFYFVTNTKVQSIIFFAAVSILLVLLKLALFTDDHAGWMIFVNRGISVAAIIIVTVFAVRQKRLQQKLDTERELHMRALRRKNEKLETYRQSLNLHLLVTVIDKDGLIIYVNKPFSRISKYSPDELDGRSFFSIGELSEKEKIEIQDTIHSGQSWRGEIKSRAKDGSVYWCDTVIFPIKDHDGNVVEYFSIGMPITDRKVLEQEQEKNLKAFETILWKVSHKLRAPIATCQGITLLLDKKHEAGSGMDEIETAAMLNRRHCTNELEAFSREIISIIESKGVGKTKAAS